MMNTAILVVVHLKPDFATYYDCVSEFNARIKIEFHGNTNIEN